MRGTLIWRRSTYGSITRGGVPSSGPVGPEAEEGELASVSLLLAAACLP